MKDIIITLVFSSAILVMMIYPAIKITSFIESKTNLNDKAYGIITVCITILLSVVFGSILNFS